MKWFCALFSVAALGFVFLIAIPLVENVLEWNALLEYAAPKLKAHAEFLDRYQNSISEMSFEELKSFEQTRIRFEANGLKKITS